MQKAFVVTAALVLLCLGTLAQATVTIDTVPVGNANNAADTTGYGSVGYSYNIGKYEVTAGQHTAFLNAVARTDTYALYSEGMWTTSGGSGITRSGESGSYTYSVATAFVNRPINYVSWGDAARFVNWLHNGQPTGLQVPSTTEDGVYYLNGATTNAELLAVTRRTGWKWAISSEDEWYKAAYYKGGNTSAGYWDYPTSSDIAPGRDMADGSGNNANWYSGSGTYPIDSSKYTTIVGEFQNSESPYGTFDQGGSVLEWNEAVIYGVHRGWRGGSYVNDAYMRSSERGNELPLLGFSNLGFRVVQAVPEPSGLLFLALGLAGLSGLARKRR